MSAVAKLERPAVSLSMAGMCRMKIWLASQEREQDPILPRTQRLFDAGHRTEQSLFEGFTDGDGQIRPSWWATFEEISDPATGEKLNPPEWQVGSRQEVVIVDDIAGHLDAIIKSPQDEFRLVDAKSARAFSFTKLAKADLATDLFARQYVMQLQMYMEGKRLDGDRLGIRDALLFFINKDDLYAMFRAVRYDSAMVEEGRERLSWSKSKAEPVPDWEWSRGQDIPTMCGYCSFRTACSEMRGMALELRIEKNAPKWRVK